jgi:hypothetical protein
MYRRSDEDTTIRRHCLVDEAICRYICGKTKKTAENEQQTNLPRGGGGLLRWSCCRSSYSGQLTRQRFVAWEPFVLLIHTLARPDFDRSLLCSHGFVFRLDSLERFHAATTQGRGRPWGQSSLLDGGTTIVARARPDTVWFSSCDCMNRNKPMG